MMMNLARVPSAMKRRRCQHGDVGRWLGGETQAQPTMNDSPLDGLAFDTNLLNKPTQRRLMSLWMERSESKVFLLPQVRAELTTPNMRPGTCRDLAINTAHRQAWDDVVAKPNSPFQTVELTREQQVLASAILHSFTLRCFPKLNNVDEVLRNSDSIILAEGLAAQLDCVVTNNMASIDHQEVNHLVTRTMGRNASFVRTADDAMLEAHPGGEASRELLTTAMASCWPDNGVAQSIDDAHERLERLCSVLVEGVNMPAVAQRLRNAFDVDLDLDAILVDAHAVSRSSSALACERERKDLVVSAGRSHTRDAWRGNHR